MDNKQSTTTTTTSHRLGMCEKLFNAFQPTLRPLRRLTFRHQEVGSANHPDSSDAAHQTKLPEPIASPQVQQTYNPKTEPKLLPSRPPPKPEVVPLGTVTQPPPPPPPMSGKTTKKGINEKVDEYITRTKGKIKSTASSVGKVAASK